MMQDDTKIILTANAARKNSSRAQGMVEFALTLPILLMLLLGVVEFGRMLFNYSAVISAAREAARYGAAGGNAASGVAYYRDCDGIRAAAMRIGGFAGIENNATGIQITYDEGPGADINVEPASMGNCPVGGTGPLLDRGDRVIVTVTARFTPSEGIVPLPSFNISSTVRRTIIINVVLD